MRPPARTSRKRPRQVLAADAGGKGKFKVMDNEDQVKQEVLEDLKETVEVRCPQQILESKIQKLEMLVRLKDEKIDKLQNKLKAHNQAID